MQVAGGARSRTCWLLPLDPLSVEACTGLLPVNFNCAAVVAVYAFWELRLRASRKLGLIPQTLNQASTACTAD